MVKIALSQKVLKIQNMFFCFLKTTSLARFRQSLKETVNLRGLGQRVLIKRKIIIFSKTHQLNAKSAAEIGRANDPLVLFQETAEEADLDLSRRQRRRRVENRRDVDQNADVRRHVGHVRRQNADGRTDRRTIVGEFEFGGGNEQRIERRPDQGPML